MPDAPTAKIRAPVFPRFPSLLVSVTEVCHVGCRHCGFIGAKRERESEPAEMGLWIRQACAYGVPLVIFTGGEPFERFEVLASGVAAAAESDAEVGIFTSSYWGTSFEAARDTLSRLRRITRLYLSTDVFHQRNVPYRRVYNVIDAALDLGVPETMLCITYANRDELKQVKQQYADYGDRVLFHEDRVIPTPFIGKALKDQGPMLPPSPSDYKPTCYLFTPLINPNGDLIACHIGKVGARRDIRELPYWLGNLREASFVDIMEKARGRWDYQFLRTHGPAGIAQVVADNPNLLAAVGRNGFTNGCDLCFSVLRTPEGRAALSAHVGKTSVREAIDIRLALGLSEAPVEALKGTPVG